MSTQHLQLEALREGFRWLSGQVVLMICLSVPASLKINHRPAGSASMLLQLMTFEVCRYAKKDEGSEKKEQAESENEVFT